MIRILSFFLLIFIALIVDADLQASQKQMTLKNEVFFNLANQINAIDNIQEKFNLIHKWKQNLPEALFIDSSGATNDSVLQFYERHHRWSKPTLIKLGSYNTQSMSYFRISPDSSLFIHGTNTGWSIYNNHCEIVQSYEFNECLLFDGLFTSDGSKIILRNRDGIKVLDAKTLQTLFVITNPGLFFEITSDNKKIITFNNWAWPKGIIAIYDLDNGNLISKIEDEFRDRYVLNDNCLLTFNDEGFAANLWDIPTGSKIKTIKSNYKLEVIDCFLETDNQKLIICTSANNVYSINILTNTITLLGCCDTFKGLKISPDKKKLALAGSDSYKFFDVHSETFISDIKADTSRAMLKFYSSDKVIMVDGEYAHIYKIANGSLMKSIKLHDAYIKTFTMLKNNRVLTCSADKTLKLWDFSYDMPKCTYSVRLEDGPQEVSVSNNKDYVTIQFGDTESTKKFAIYDVQTGSHLFTGDGRFKMMSDDCSFIITEKYTDDYSKVHLSVFKAQGFDQLFGFSKEEINQGKINKKAVNQPVINNACQNTGWFSRLKDFILKPITVAAVSLTAAGFGFLIWSKIKQIKSAS